MVWGGLQDCCNSCCLVWTLGSPVTYMVATAGDIPQQGELQYGLNLINSVQHCLFSIVYHCLA